MRCSLLWLVGLLLVPMGAVAGEVQSSAPTVDLQLFHPTAGANNLVTVETGDVNSHLGVSVGLNLNYAGKPLAVQIVNSEGGKDDIGAVVGNRVDAVLLAALGLFDVGELGVAVPVVWQGGLDSGALEGANVAVGVTKLTAYAMGDVRVIPKIRLLNLGDGLFSAAVVGTVVVPTGTADYARENNIVYAPSVALSSRAGFLRAGVDAGYRLRDRTRLEPVPGQVLLNVDDEVFAKLGVAFDVNMGQGKPFEIVGELFGHTPANDAFAMNAKAGADKDRQLSRTSLEGDLGIRWNLTDSLILTGGAGGGLTKQGYGQPVPRVYLGVMHYTGSSGIVDSDQDGVPDASDLCADKKEDRDNFEDGDGCPEADNDKDGVDDEDDQCPNEAEDRDGLMDEDGCPETDADQDGVLDEQDKCNGQLEDKDGFQDDDGCPDPDNDGDHIADGVDKCPDKAEDVDGFQDEDGCPDEDNDGDGLKDLGDLCPNYPEDKDGVADDDGCPEDNDGDGIADELDKCPNEAEIYNGVEDDDGCPEKVQAKSLVQVTEEKIVIKDMIYFKTGSAGIMSKSFALLDQVAAVLKNYKHLKKVRIEGHTDNVGGRAKNVKLSRERAESVRKYLIDKGIEAGRLDFEGYGPDKPIASNKTAKGKEQNRRVEFVIVEQTPIGKDVSEGQRPTPPPATEPVFDLGPATTPPATPPPAAAPGGDSMFEIGPGPAEVTPAPAAPAPDDTKGKKGKGKKGKGKEKDKPADQGGEVKFEF